VSALTALPRAPFEITPEQEEIRRVCRDFAAKEIRPISLAVEKWMRDAKLEEIEEGTSDIQRLVIARDLVHD
jgi:hypothetical protein